jgi:3-oxoacyl-[acyl-carrier protein] reductase
MNRPTVLITGAARGIGRGTALALAEQGCKLGLIDRDAGLLDEVAVGLTAKGITVSVASADVTDRESLTRAVLAIEAKLGPTDVLIAWTLMG